MINYRFNEWRNSGEPCDKWSPMAYRIVSKNTGSEQVNGFRIGHILYLHHIKGMTAKEIKEVAGHGIATNMIKSILKGFGRLSGYESLEAYDIAMYLVECQPEVLEKMYSLNEYRM
ncbi:hypothetical protein [Ornithinibacillus contaminans]|uniref:hypothetical protein n=1 Tax=Ornithinibacillus contaminans TaxID=694055 RepID=UPI00064D97F8|nr:hypothetical protein [Ornithinibacillus contaminans]